MKLRVSTVWLAVALVPGLAGAEVCGWWPEYVVNTYTTNYQRDARIAAREDGSFIVAWTSRGSPEDDTDYGSIQARLFAADGSPVDGLPEFQVNTVTTGGQFTPDVAADANGNFVVVWNHRADPPGGGDSDIRGQRFAADASPMGGEFAVNTVTSLDQLLTTVAADEAGNFVVSWGSAVSLGTDSDGYSVQARRYDSDGNALGPEFQVNSYTTDTQFSPHVAMAPTGGFIVTWNSRGSFGSDDDALSIQFRRFDTSGSPLGPEFQVNTYTTGQQVFDQIGFDPTGAFVVVWASVGSPADDSDLTSVQARLFDASGVPRGDQFQVNSFASGGQSRPVVAVVVDGSFVVTYTSTYGSFDVRARAFDADGTPRGPGSLVNRVEPDLVDRSRSAIGMDPAGRYVIAWQHDDSVDDEDEGILFRRLHNRPLLCDGFESGDTSAWSVTIP